MIQYRYTGAVLAGALLALASCKDKNSFTLSGNIDHAKAGSKVYLLMADSADIKKIDSADINQQNTFQFKHSSPHNQLFKLQIGEDTFDFIAQNGDDVNFRADMSDSSHTYQITGSAESEKIQEFNRISNVYSAKNAKLAADFESLTAQGKNRDSLLATYRPVFQKNIDDNSKATLEFINDNQTSLAAFYAAMSVDPQKYEQQLVAYADAIKGKFNHDPLVEGFIKQMERVKPLSVGHKAPEFAVNSIDGKPVRLSDYKGKYVMLDFWASWCVPCRRENPNVVKQYALYKGKGLNILGISLDQEKADWQKAVKDDGITWQQASDLKRFDGPMEQLFQIEAIPSNFIIDPNGMIVAKNVTGDDLSGFLKKTFK